MNKILLFFVITFSLLASENVQAQKLDSVVVNMLESGVAVGTKDSADYILHVITPPVEKNGLKINQIHEFYKNGKPKLFGDAIIDIVGFNRLRIRLIDKCTVYYPNGKLYTITQYSEAGLPYYIECRDSTGNIEATNGAGEWKIYDADFKTIIEEGPVKEMLKEGEWHENYHGQPMKVLYDKGDLLPDKEDASKSKIFTAVEKEPEYPGGVSKFYKDISDIINYPEVDKQNKISGRVVVSFIVEKNGRLSEIQALSGPSETLKAEAVRAVASCQSWTPGIQNAKPVRVRFTVPVTFSLGNNKVFQSSETQPEFPGGASEFYKFLQKTIIYSAIDRKNNLKTRVMISFIVEKDGSLSNIHCLRASSSTLCDAVVEAVQKSPQWKPGLQAGMPVRVEFTFPVAVDLSSNDN